MVVCLGDLACQENSYLRELETTIVEVTNTSCSSSNNNSNDYHSLDVIFADTVFFPTGGGQPHDLGTVTIINEKDKDNENENENEDEDEEVSIASSSFQVIDVFREEGGKRAVHRIRLDDDKISNSFFRVGTRVLLVIDWNRRFDHMQQHSGQHVLSAIAEKDFSIETISWSLGAEKCTVDLKISSTQLDWVQALEDRINETIQAAIPVSTDKTIAGTNDGISRETFQTIPYQCESERIVKIESVDSCRCCGTHVSNTRELVMVKLMDQQKVKGGLVRLDFVFGGRALVLFQSVYGICRQLKSTLNVPFGDIVSSIGRTNGLLKSQKKSLDSVVKAFYREWLTCISLKKRPDQCIFVLNNVSSSTSDELHSVGSVDGQKVLQNMVRLPEWKVCLQDVILFVGADQTAGAGGGDYFAFTLIDCSNSNGNGNHDDGIGVKLLAKLGAKGFSKNGITQGKSTKEATTNRDIKELISSIITS